MSASVAVTLHSIYISPGHDFFGRHGKGRLEHGIDSIDSVECVAGKGLRGDRFFGYKEDYKGQVTFFSLEIVESLVAHFQLEELDCSEFRRNVIISGVDLNALIGRRFVIGEVEFEAVEECRPCYWMDETVVDGAWEFMKGQGGLRCRILKSGTLSSGDFELNLLDES